MIKRTALAFSIAVCLLTSLRADQTNQAPGATNSQPARPPFNSLTPEERAARIQELRTMHGFTNAPVGLSPAERQARIKKRIEELHRKKAEGTLTPAESKQLEILERSTNRPLPSLRLPQTTNSSPQATNFHFLSK
jgi:hypothetical protein